MTEAILAAAGIRMMLKFMGIGVLVVAILAWLGGVLKDKIL